MDTSKIKDIRVEVLELPLKKQWKIALYAANTRSHAVLRVVTEDGVIGYGETSPSPAFMGETAYTIKLVVDRYLAPALIGQNVFDIGRIHDIMDTVIYGNYAAKATVDIALYDAMGKSLGVPVYKLLGGQYRKRVELSWVVGMQDLEGAIDEAKRNIELGYKVMKVKVGNSPEIDYNLVKSIREALGPEVKIRLDANQGYDCRTAVEVFSKLEQFDLESIEQPVRRWDIEGMKFLRSKLKTPIMADESVSCLYDGITIIREKAADIVNIKVGKVGGLYVAKQIAGALEAAGMAATAGSNLEVGVGSAASVHFVASSKNVSLPNDLLLGAPLHEYDIIDGGLDMADGEVVCPEGPGLGVEVDTSIFNLRK